MNKNILIYILALGLFGNVYADNNQDKHRKENPPTGGPNYVMQPGHLMKREEPVVRHEGHSFERHTGTTTIINTLPPGSFIQYGTRVAPIIVERNYYAPQTRPDLSYSQQQSNFRLINEMLSSNITRVVDLGFGYFVPGPDGQVYYHSKNNGMAPIPISDFLVSDEYYYLTGERR